ncbi:MAG TPA: HEAT repeat domain-containing protein [Roseiflexaceae bacterium]|nr:HEAT repeat domain-containing protein [Roseiflexaceae bacterium]
MSWQHACASAETGSGYALSGRGEITPAAIPALLVLLGSNDSELSACAADQIALLFDEAAPQLIAALGPRNPLLAALDDLLSLSPRRAAAERRRRERIADLLGRLGTACIPLLVEALDHPCLGVRAALARALACYGTAAVPALLAALEDKRRCGGAADALAAIGRPACRPLTNLLRQAPPCTPQWYAASAALRAMDAQA